MSLCPQLNTFKPEQTTGSDSETQYLLLQIYLKCLTSAEASEPVAKFKRTDEDKAAPSALPERRPAGQTDRPTGQTDRPTVPPHQACHYRYQDLPVLINPPHKFKHRNSCLMVIRSQNKHNVRQPLLITD